MQKILIFVLLFFCFLASQHVESTASGSVLFYMAFISQSIKITFMPVAEELAKRGHQVTIITSYKSSTKVENIKEIVVESDHLSIGEQFSTELLSGNNDMSTFDVLKMTAKAGIATNENVLNNPEVKKLFTDGSKFDVVINCVLLANEVGYYFAHKFNSTLILYYTVQSSNVIIDLAMGQPHNPAITSMFFPHPMTFLTRVANTLIETGLVQVRNFFILPQLEKMIDEHFPEDPRDSRPRLIDLESNAGLAFHFGHPLIMDGLRPMAPNYIQIGMMNCRPAQPLPQNLKDFLDGADDEHGAIFVSFGSVLTGSKMSEESRKLLVDVFGSLKQRVLWKWETETMADKPANLMLSKWLPQQDVLAHPKVKLFISHGGQSSCQESLCHQKPLLVISVLGDQPANGEEAVHKGYGIHIPFAKLAHENLKEALHELFSNPKYSNEAKRRGNLLLDQIDQPLDRAVWWIEYAMRHPGIKHLRSPVHDLTWYQYFLLDVFAFLAFIVSIVILAFYFCCKCLCCRRNAKQKKE